MIYFDNAATRLPKSNDVLKAVQDAGAGDYGNPGRGGHGCAIKSGTLIWQVRSSLAGYLGVDPLRLVWASSGTDALNQLIHGLSDGTRVWTTPIEHNSVIRPLRERERRGTLSVHMLPVTKNGALDLNVFPEILTSDVLMVSAGSNVLGLHTDLKSLRQKVGSDVSILIDAAQVMGEMNPSTYVPWVNGLAAPGHKGIGGPPGTGFLWVDEKINLRPFRQGGTGSNSESPLQPEDWPDGFEAGSTNLWGIAGLGAAVSNLIQVSEPLEMWRAWEILVHRLSELEGCRIISCLERSWALPLVTFVLEGIDPGQFAWDLWQEHGIAVRAGLHCAPGAHKVAGTFETGAIRASLSPDNTCSEAEQFIHAIHALLK